MVWTNAVGVAFAATLLSAGEQGATFVFPEDGATNTLAWAQLAPDSARRACEATGYIRVPPSLVPTLNMARRERARLDALVADGRLEAERADQRRRRVFELFARKCCEKGLTREDAARLFSEHP